VIRIGIEATSRPRAICTGSVPCVDGFRRRLKCKIAISDTDLVTPRARTIQGLIADSLYAVDERMVADAVVARLMVRLTVSEPSFRSDCRGPQAKSCRPDPLAGRSVSAIRRTLGG
jgi:hypothetical protein